MADAARVTSIDALGRFRAALADFTERASLSLSNAENDVQRTIWWLQNDQVHHWQRMIKRFEKELSEAKAELLSAQLQARDTRPSLVLERKRVAKAERGLEEARTKLERTKHWARTMEREFMLFKGAINSLGGRLDRDMPMAMARLAKLIGHLEKYVKMSSPAASSGSPAAVETEADEAKEES